MHIWSLDSTLKCVTCKATLHLHVTLMITVINIPKGHPGSTQLRGRKKTPVTLTQKKLSTITQPSQNWTILQAPGPM